MLSYISIILFATCSLVKPVAMIRSRPGVRPSKANAFFKASASAFGVVHYANHKRFKQLRLRSKKLIRLRRLKPRAGGRGLH